MPETMLRRQPYNRRFLPKDTPSNLSGRNPQRQAVIIPGPEFCPGCNERITVAREEAWLTRDNHFLKRLGPCHPGCHTTIERLYPKHQIWFGHPTEAPNAN